MKRKITVAKQALKENRLLLTNKNLSIETRKKFVETYV